MNGQKRIFPRNREKNKVVKGILISKKQNNERWTSTSIIQYIGGTRSSKSWKVIKTLIANRKRMYTINKGRRTRKILQRPVNRKEIL